VKSVRWVGSWLGLLGVRVHKGLICSGVGSEAIGAFESTRGGEGGTRMRVARERSNCVL